MIHFTDFAIANLGLIGSTRGYLGAIQGQINLGDEIEPEYTVPWFWMDGEMGETLSAAVSVSSGLCHTSFCCFQGWGISMSQKLRRLMS